MTEDNKLDLGSFEQAKLGKHSPFSAADIAEQFGADAQCRAVVTRTAQGRYLFGSRRRAQAQLTAGDPAELKAQVTLQEVFGLERAIPQLDQCCRIVPMPKLIMTTRSATSSSASRKVAKGQEPDLNLNKFLKTDMECWLNASFVAGYWEDNWESDVPIMSVTQENAADSLKAARNLDIADELANASTVTGEDWGAGTLGASTYSPVTKIMEAWMALCNGGTDNALVKAAPAILACHPLVWGDFIINSHIYNYVHAGLVRTPPPGGLGSIEIPMLPALRVVLDPDLVNTSAFLIDPKYMLLGQGPTQSIAYANDLKRVEGHVLYEYLQPKLVWDQSATYTIGVREITGSHA
jgi:hypothetical protein